MAETTCPSCQAQLPEAAAFCPRCGTRFGGAMAAGAAEIRPADLSHQLALVLGDGYQVRGLVGRGGFAEVYEVYDLGLARRLAVKVLRPDIAWTPGMLARFRDEARVVASLNHPNILPIHFVGEGHGLTYYVMPFVDGHSVGNYLRDFGALDVARALEIAVPLLEALAHAHRAGLLHRDIKPDNVMIDAVSGRALLVDFGIAKRLDADAGRTQTGFVIGTPQYMSPEQALGDTQVDIRSDLYAFGALLFQMLTGAPPYDGDSSQEIVGKHIAAPVPAPADRNARIPIWLSEIIVKCLAKRPIDRYQSADLVIAAIREGQAGRQDGPSVTAGQVAHRVSAQLETPASSAAPTPSVAPAPRRGRGALLALIPLVAGLVWWFFVRPASVLVANQLTVPAVLILPAGDSLIIDPGSEIKVRLPEPAFTRLIWRTDPLRSAGGAVHGYPLSGEVAVEAGRGTTPAALSLAHTRVPMFSPLITNETGGPLRFIVNAGLDGAANCGCEVPAGALRMAIGFYPLYRNTTVRAVDSAGRTATFNDLGTQVDPTGFVGLRFEPANFR
ncbi:MAG: protein kinase domain-containing protein [Gemmatimonadales bacterium]